MILLLLFSSNWVSVFASPNSHENRQQAAMPAAEAGTTAPTAPTGLTINDNIRPLEVEGTPQFGWYPQDVDENEIQTAYQIQVNVEKDGSLVWDSGKVVSSEMQYISYTGAISLTSDTSYTWRVKTWDRTDLESPWSEYARFDMGIGDSEWGGASWIRRITTGNDSTEDYTLARKQVTVGSSPVIRARAYVATMGQYELYVNGESVYRGDSFTYPGEGYYQSSDITDLVTPGGDLAIGVLYHYWVCTCQGRANGPACSTTLAAASVISATTVKVASIAPMDVGDSVNIDTGTNLEQRTITAIGTAGSGGTGVTLNAPLSKAHASNAAFVSLAGPSALLVRIVVDHQDGSQDVFVSDGTWKVTKATQYTNATLTYRNSDAGDRVERYDARKEISGWNTAGFDDSGWSAPYVIGTHPRPVNTLRDSFSHVSGGEHRLGYKTVRPETITRLSDGTIVADFGAVISAMPVLTFTSGISGTAMAITTTYRLNNTTLSTAVSSGDSNIPMSGQSATTQLSVGNIGDTNIKVGSVSTFKVGDKVAVGTGTDQEIVTLTGVGTAGSSTTLLVSSAISATNIKVASVSGMAAGNTLYIDTGSNLETAVISGSVGTAGSSGTLAAAVAASATTLTTRLSVSSGYTLYVDTGANQEIVTVSAVSGGTTKTVTFTPALTKAHASGATLVYPGTGVNLTAALTKAHASAAIIVNQSSLGTGITFTPAFTKAHTYGSVVQDLRVTGFSIGDTITVDAPGDNAGTSTSGNPEVRTIANIIPTGTSGQVYVVLDSPLTSAHSSGVLIEGSRAGTTSLDTQGSTMTWYYTQKDGEQRAQAFTYWGWRYLQINPYGQTLSDEDIAAVLQHSATDDAKRASFHSSNTTLDAVFEMMMRSGIYSSEETFLDTPTREKGQFLGDTVDITYAIMSGFGERDATQRAIKEIIYSGAHSWKATSSYCSSAPCSYSSLSTPGRLNAVYPNGDNMRDIPDYTLMFPEWVMRYYLMTGDKAMVEYAYPTMKAVADYVKTYEATSGTGAGLVYNLYGGSGDYQYGIIDWPSGMRYGYTSTKNSSRTLHNAEAVGAFNDTAWAASLLGYDADVTTYTTYADDLKTTINNTLWLTTTLRYSDAYLSTGSLATNTAMHAQTFPIYYGVAPESQYEQLGEWIDSQGMKQGPMTLYKLLKALAIVDRPDTIVNLLSDPTIDGPAQGMAAGGTYMWEEWDPTGSNSFSHGWGSWGLASILEDLLGVQVTSPGAAAIKIAPPDKGLDYANGSMWTQRGMVDVNWESDTCDFSLTVDIPVNITATVYLPPVSCSDDIYLHVDGDSESRTMDGDLTVIENVGSGTHTFTLGTDTYAPKTTAHLSPATVNGFFASIPTLSFTAKDGDSGVMDIQFSIDSNSNIYYTQPISVTGDGTHTIDYFATDKASNVEATQTLSLTVDTVDPTVDAGGPYQVTDGSSVTLRATGSDFTSGVAGYAWDLDNNGSFETPGQSVPLASTALGGAEMITVTVKVSDYAGHSATDLATVSLSENDYSTILYLPMIVKQ